MDLNETPEHAEYRLKVRRVDRGAPGRVAAAGAGAPRRRPGPLPRLAGEARRGGSRRGDLAGGATAAPASARRSRSSSTPSSPRAGCSGIVDHIAIGELGPTIIAYGTEEQKQRYLGPMLRGEEGWCQLFSEPARRLRPRRDPDPRPARRTAAGRSAGRRSGRRWPSTPTSACCWREPTPTSPSTAA